MDDGTVDGERTAARNAVTALAMVAGAAVLLIVAFQGSPAVLDYATGLVPWGIPLVAGALAIGVAELGIAPDFESSVLAKVLIGGLLVLTGWSAAPLLFDLLRLEGLVPLPVSWWGLGLRVLLVAAAALAVAPVAAAARFRRGRCDECGRWLPGSLSRLPRWPAALGLLFALPYPVFRIHWLLGGTVGRTGPAATSDPGLEWAMASLGLLLVGLAVVLLVGRGPGWARAALGFGGMVVGTLLVVTFGPAAVSTLLSPPTGAEFDPGLGLAGWIPPLFYGSWLLAGLGVAIGGWRYWEGRRLACPACGPLLAS